MPRPARDRVEPRLVTRKGRRNWYLEWVPLGAQQPRRQSTGIPHEGQSEPPVEARQQLEDLRAQLGAAGQDSTVSEILAQRERDARGRVEAVTLRNLQQQHKMVRRHLGHLQPDQITRARLLDYMNRDRGGAMTAVARELEELRSAYRLAGLEVPTDWPIPKKKPPRDRWLSHAEARKLIQATEGVSLHLRLFVLIALQTGARKNAILDLTWDRVREDRGVIDFNNPEKNVTKKRRPISRIDQRLCAVLQDARNLALSDHVIEWQGRPCADIKKGFGELAVDSGFYRLDRDRKGQETKRATISPHVLKHTAISWLAEAGYSIDQIADMTDTEAATVKRIYRHVAPDYLAPLSKTLADAVFGESDNRIQTIG